MSRKNRTFKAYCCVVGCKNTSGNPPGTRFYSFPTAAFEHRQLRRQKWIDAMRRQNPDGSPWKPTKSSRICSRHFVGNAKSENPASSGYDPTIFPNVYRKSIRNEEVALGRYKRRPKRKCLMNNTEILLDTRTKCVFDNKSILQNNMGIQQETKVEDIQQNDFDRLLPSNCSLIELGSSLSTTKSIETQVDFLENSDDPNYRIFLCNRYISLSTCEAEVQICIPGTTEERGAKIGNRVDKSCGTDVRIEDLIWTGRARFRLQSSVEMYDRLSWDLVHHKRTDNARSCGNYLPDVKTFQ